MTDIDEIFSKMPLKENVGIDDAERQMKFCIIAHIAPGARDEKSVTKEERYLAFKKIYRVLVTLPSSYQPTRLKTSHIHRRIMLKTF